MSRRRGLTETDNYQQVVQSYVAAGGDEQVQQVITAVHRLSRRLNQSYDRQLADLDVSTGEWAVLAELARANGEALTPSRLAEAAGVAPSSMTHRLDGMVQRGLVTREGDPGNRTRVLVRLADPGWSLFTTSIQQANVVESDVLSALTPAQLRDLSGLLERLLANLDSLK
ncbi:MarR family winged helix-turn-helix transcriptional regulator [Microlunatus sp. GCM10028923]|uniref:MarR family winged helix-turn-helix transcriptional regulator n=1 Tax=Microlunatus sp. GCM10028923 TaxID=3273400 RepID=UPI0036094B34